MRLYGWILAISLVILAIFGIHALIIKNHFFYDFIFSVTFLSILYKSRKDVALSEIHYGIICFLVIAHNAGVFGAYEISILGFAYDVFLHFSWGVVLGAVGLRYLTLSKKYNYLKVYAYSFIFLLVITGMHELVEYTGGKFLGRGDGIFFIGFGDADENDPYDTMEDIINNILGGLTAMFFYWRKNARRRIV